MAFAKLASFRTKTSAKTGSRAATPKMGNDFFHGGFHFTSQLRPFRCHFLRSSFLIIAACRDQAQAACSSGTLINDSAGMPSHVCNRQSILRVSGRLRLSTS